jgi:hypothetical protein
MRATRENSATVLTAYTEEAVVTVAQTKPDVSIQMPEPAPAVARGSGQCKKGRAGSGRRDVMSCRGVASGARDLS